MPTASARFWTLYAPISGREMIFSSPRGVANVAVMPRTVDSEWITRISAELPTSVDTASTFVAAAPMLSPSGSSTLTTAVPFATSSSLNNRRLVSRYAVIVPWTSR